MGHTYVDIVIIGSKGEHQLRNIMVDTGATYSVIPEEILEAVGSSKLPGKVSLELGNGRAIEADSYAALLRISDREGPIIAVTFKNAKPVVGVHSLESLGLKVNPVTGQLEETRPKGIAYFYGSILSSGARLSNSFFSPTSLKATTTS